VRLTVIYNPKAGSRGWPKGAIEERLKAAGHDARLISSKTDWRSALGEPADAFVAAGGDGTVHKLARMLSESGGRLAMIPLGTANNLARAFGYAPGSDPFARVPHWGEEQRTLRIECAQTDGRHLPFLEVMGAGAFARLLTRDGGKKGRLPLASLMAARRKLLDEVMEGPVLQTEIALDGRPVEGRYVLVASLRTPSFGPALWLAPQQRPDDEALTLVGVRNDQREAFAWWLATGEGDVGAFQLGTGKRIELTVDGPVHVDDRLVESEEPIAVTVDGGAKRLTVLV
jgi:diacylglycerol kinase (ATP)